MKLKICFLLFVVLCFTPTICKAKSIDIGGVTYNVNTILEEENFTYNAYEDTLILKGINVNKIRTSNDLKIILEGDNYISNTYTNIAGIEARNLEISGNGKLIINTNYRGIYSKTIKIIDAIIEINSPSYSCLVTYEGDITIENGKLVLSSNSSIFFATTNNVYLNNSLIIIKKSYMLIDIGVKNIYIYNSNVYILECSKVRYNERDIYINGNSNMYIYSTNNEIKCSVYVSDDNLLLMGSNDNLNYDNITDLSEKPKYLIITTKDSNNLEEQLNTLQQELDNYKLYLENRELELNNQEQLLNEQLQNIEAKEEQLDNLVIKTNEEKETINILKEELLNKQQDLNNKEIYLNEQQKILLENQNNNKIKEDEIKMQEDNNKTDRNNLNDIQNEINYLSKKLIIKEQDLLKKQQYLTSKEEELNNKEKIINTKNNDLKVEEEKQKYGEVLEDDLLESVFEITNQRPSSLKYIIGFVLSFLSGGIAFICLNKWRLHG